MAVNHRNFSNKSFPDLASGEFGYLRRVSAYLVTIVPYHVSYVSVDYEVRSMCSTVFASIMIHACPNLQTTDYQLFTHSVDLRT